MATRTWTGGAGDFLWTSPNNWSGNAVPLATDDVVVVGAMTINMDDGSRPCLTFDGSAFTGTLTNGALQPHGAFVRIGAGCHLALGEGLQINSVGTVSITAGAGALIDFLWVQIGSIAIASDLIVTDYQNDNGGAVALGAHTLTISDGFDNAGSPSAWTWADGGQIVFTGGAPNVIGGGAVSPSLPPIVITAGLTLNGGDLTVDHIISQAGVITLNGHRIIELHPAVVISTAGFWMM